MTTSSTPKKALRVLALAVPIFAIFATGVVVLALALGFYRGTAITDRGTLTLACLCSLIVGLFLLAFHMKHWTAVVPCKNRQAVIATCRALLKDLGYEVHMKSNDELVSRPSFRALLLGGRIHVEGAGNEVKISGPKMFVEIVRRRLRVHCHLTQAEQTPRDARVHHGDRLLKRVQISVRLTPQQWHNLGQGILQQLGAAGAEVFCEVHVMAQSQEGIRESLVDGPLRDWLQQRHLQAEVHKDHARWDEPLARTPSMDLTETQVESLGCERAL
jgi:hypothetical protein